MLDSQGYKVLYYQRFVWGQSVFSEIKNNEDKKR